MNEHFYCAIDLGATSGRVVIGKLSNGKVSLTEISRFPNNLVNSGNHIYWDINALFNEIIQALKTIAHNNIKIESIGIDSWGVDFVCIGADGEILNNPIAYRDQYTVGAMNHYIQNVHSQKEIYDITGIQLMNFNTLFQLYAMQQERNIDLEKAEKILFVPDAISYLLTGEAVCEHTIASTGEIIDIKTGRFSDTLLESVGLNANKFGAQILPGTKIASLSPKIQELTGLNDIPVVAVAGHDTASAVLATPAQNKHFAYLSSGTWSLLGIESKSPIVNELSYTQNFTNEGGVDSTIRFLKNICGMWIIEQCRKEWGDSVPCDYATLFADAAKAPEPVSFINPDDEIFASPQSMLTAIDEYCKKTNQVPPKGYAAVVRCVMESLAKRYAQVMEMLKQHADFEINTLHIIGGGSRNSYLNQLTADATGLEVIAGPQECTAIGNILLQAKANGIVSTVAEMREIVANSFELDYYKPRKY